jgi:molecular chaperone DnaK (HSP70)
MIVGIDLGTTHTVVAYAADDVAKLFPVSQLVASGQRDVLPLLPSNLYAPLEAESEQTWICGELARARGGEVTQRHVSSAKSWLSYGGVDRRAAILPWELEGESAPKLSPVQASSLVLKHVESVWDAAFPNERLRSQEVVLTVPASFDAVARELTVEAARAAGLEVRLLEEPQAAFYDFMRLGGDDALNDVMGDADDALVLVCDVGGGTTDLSLMRVRRDGLEIERVAVGKHLLLGGDNMDLALAHMCERRLVAEGMPSGGVTERLEPRRFAQLIAACRIGKEKLLAEGAPETWPISLASRGAKLVGGALRTELTRDEARQVVLEGFFPEVAFDEPAAPASRAGILAFGLPYERDPAITRHLRAFLQRHQEKQGLPTAVLFNGGLFRAPAVAQRIHRTLEAWRGSSVRVLSLTDPDTSVALGAVTYGLSLRGKGRRIGGGASKSYFLGLRGEQAVCVLPCGTEEGDVKRVDRDMEVIVNKAVRFDIYASDLPASLGSLSGIGREHQRLAPLVTTLEDYSGKKKLKVALEAELSAIGTLELSCVELAAEKPRHFALAFDLRVDEEGGGHEVTTAASRYGKRLEEARAAVESVYSKRTRKSVEQKEVKGLVRELERIFGKRSKWDASLLRALYDVVWTHHRGRKTTEDHERIFWMLAGFCLRPGIGHARDEERVAALFKLFEQRLAHGELRSWQQFWISWRRVSAGLTEKAQVKLRDIVDPFVGGASKTPKSFRNDAAWEMLELAASLERVPAARRGELGSWILERTWTERDPRLWAALGRVGARLPIYGSAHHVVSARTVEKWMDHLLREKWNDIATAPRAAVAMCRLTGDRERDVSDDTRSRVAKRLRDLGVEEERVRPVTELVALDDVDRAAFYGEDLPVGLELVE